MNNKFTKTYILGAVLIIALGILIIPKFIKNGDETNEPKKMFNFVAADINEIQLEYPDQLNKGSGERQTVLLKKIDGEWIVISNNSYKARKNDINTLLEKAAEITQGELISSNPDRQEILEIGPQSGTHVRLQQDANAVADFWLGKNGAGGNATYVRLDGSDLVYASKGNIRFYFQKPDWIDRTILKLDKEQINKISLKIGWGNIVLEREVVPAPEIVEEEEPIESVVDSPPSPKATTDKEETKWNVIKPWKFEADESKVNSLLNTVSNFSAQEVIFDKTIDEAGLAHPKSKVIIETADSETPYEILIGNKIETPQPTGEDEAPGGQQDSYYVKLADNDQIFTISSYVVEETFSQKVDDFRILE
jgi:hypothetical protein